MKQTQFLLVALFFIQPIVAFNPFLYVNPAAWLRGIQRVYYRKQLEEAHKRLFELSAQRLELENYKRMYSLLNANLEKTDAKSQNEQEIRYRQNLTTTINQLNLAFYEKYQKETDSYHISRTQAYINEKFTPIINQAAKESYTTVEPLPQSWYEKLKEKEAKLPAKEKQKTTDQRQAEFKEWQEKYNSKAKERNDFFEEWRSKNRNYNKPHMNKI